MNEWRSLRELLEQNSPAVIASAIERHGVFVYDRYNRVVKASPESNYNYSQAKALDLIADWQAELSDPSPTYSWEHPRFELEDHPTQRFGWPAGELPNFIAQVIAVNPQNLNTPKKMWIKVAQQEALVILSEERKKGIEPKQDALAKEVATTLSRMGVRTSRGDITRENIKRMALAGEWWRKTRQRPHN